MKAPVSACIIVKNEPLLEKCLLSIRDYVEEIVVVDTGSTDNTPEIAKKYADIFEVYTGCNDPETGLINDFSDARQRSFDIATKKWKFWMDADDLLVGVENLYSLINKLESKNPNGNTCVIFPYEYAYNEIGECICRHYRERLVSNSDQFEWRNPVHEVFCGKPNVNIQMITSDEIVYKHQRQYSNKIPEPGRNLRILEKYVKENGDDDARQLYYLGLEYFNTRMLDQAKEVLIKYINISGWDDEACMACLKMVEIAQLDGNYQDGVKWGLKCIEFKETWGEGYFALAKMFYYLALQGGPNEYRYWQKCVHFAKTGLSLPETKTLLFVNPTERDVEIHCYLNVALNKLGDVRGALESVNIGLLKNKTEHNLVHNKKIYEAFLARNDIVIGVNKLKEIGEIKDNEMELLVKIINNQLDESFFQKKTNNIEIKNVKKSNGLDIVFALGNGLEIWTPKSFEKTGIGGSETMALELARRLAVLGNNVKVYNSCGNNEGFYDGVEYLRTEKYQNLNCDVLIVSRRADMLDDAFNINAKLKLLWVHDVCAINATNKLLLKADKILALTNWHKQYIMNVHNVPSDQVIVTRNGIDLNRFKKKVNRNKYKIVNSSSPDRSWPVLLDCWPEIKQQVPEAELHLYYGFHNWEMVAANDKLQMDLINRLKQQIKIFEQYGVVYHGRISQEELANEFLSAGVWAFSTWYSETSCITGMEAQAAGLHIITSSLAALNETVGNRGVLIPGEWTSPEYKQKFISSVVSAMKNSNEDDRVLVQKYAEENFGLDSLAKDWEDMFHKLIKDVEQNPISQYNPTNSYKNIK